MVSRFTTTALLWSLFCTLCFAMSVQASASAVSKLQQQPYVLMLYDAAAAKRPHLLCCSQAQLAELVSTGQFELLAHPLFCAAAKQKSFEEYEQDVWQELSQLVKDAKSLRTYLVRDRTA